MNQALEVCPCILHQCWWLCTYTVSRTSKRLYRQDMPLLKHSQRFNICFKTGNGENLSTVESIVRGEKRISVGRISSWTLCGQLGKTCLPLWRNPNDLKWLQVFWLWHTPYLKCIAPSSRMPPMLCTGELIQFQFRGKNKTYWVVTVVSCSNCLLYSSIELMIQHSSALKLWDLQG